MSTPEPLADLPFAAIDMGSNSFRLELAHLRKGRYRRLDYLKETVRLGAGLDAQGLLTEEAAQRGLDCLSRFAQRLRGFEAQRVRAVATQTLREARNRDAYLLRAQQALGYPIEVISGREEARLIFAGVARLQPSSVQRLVIDIGGRSTEMILGHQRQPKRAESFQVGSVGLSVKHFGGGRFTEAAFRAAQVEAGAELEEARVPFAAGNWSEALGSSGTVGAVSQVLAASGVSDGRITPEGLRWLMEKCLQAGRAERLELPGLKPERRAVLGGGLAILYTLATHFGIDELLPARGALRQGVIFELEERLSLETRGVLVTDRDAREATVRDLQRRFEIDTRQATQVAQLAETLFEQACAEAPLEARRELHWAAALHELGMAISHHDYHRHSAYVLNHADAAGFSQSQQRRLGELVLAQRGGLRKVETSLSKPEVAWQVLCLRLAIIKCHARHQADPRAISLSREGHRARLLFSREWAQTHPRTVYLLQEEAAAWARSACELELQLPAL